MLPLLQFRAGKMHFDGKTVIADTRRGLVRVIKGEEALVHFQWLDDAAVVEDDQIVFPEEAVFEKVTESPGRVYVLKFSADPRRFFFWMQEVSADGDGQFCKSVNYHINQQQPLEAGAVDDAPPSVDSGVGGLLNGDGSSSSAAVKLEDLQRILSSIGSEQSADEDGLGLGDILRADLIEPLVDLLPLQDRLSPYLPDDEGREKVDVEIIHLLQSPPFRQQVDSFTHVLRTGQIDLSQFGINPAKFNCTVLSFLEALEELVSREEADEAMEES